MKKYFILAFAVLLSTFAAQAAPSTLALPTNGPMIHITPLLHASFQIEHGETVIQVDPTKSGNAMHPKMADLILITDIHGDHFDEAAMRAVDSNKTLVVAPQAVIAQMKSFQGRIIRLDNGSTKNNLPGFPNVSIEAIPMYNIERGPNAGQKFHAKGRGNGYVLTLGNTRLYIAGDTEATPEMKALKNIDVAFVPMNLPFTMTPEEAAQGVGAFKPRIAIPYHYRYPFDKENNHAQQFQMALGNSKIEVSLLDWYPKTAIEAASQKQ
ncbi:MAG TPA: MBL fold metallo-hydrolase [Abditibacteriaceae bacterium]|jgi:L-ascorbate metabolism protein UlaG (beta-lactamase superfamily)